MLNQHSDLKFPWEFIYNHCLKLVLNYLHGLSAKRNILGVGDFEAHLQQSFIEVHTHAYKAQ